VRARAVRLVQDHACEYGSQWAAMVSISGKIGCTAETLRRWVRRAERAEGPRPGPTGAEQARIRELERENRELRQANEILRKASAYFAQAELDRRFKP
jgi:transposase